MTRPGWPRSRRTLSTSRRDAAVNVVVSVKPLGGGGPPADLAAMISEELATLAADAHTLQTRLVIGDVVQAVVLPSNGLTDVIDIGGLRVAAELPPTLFPGETISVEVTGFSGDRINLHVLPQAAMSSSAPAQQAASGAPAAGAPAMPSGAFAKPQLGESNVYAAQRGVNVPVPGVRAARGAPDGLGNVEARLATARATVTPPAAPNAASVGSVPKVPLTLPPVIAPRPPGSAAAPAALPGAVVPPRNAAAFSEPQTLSAALNLPITPSNVGATRPALGATRPALESPLALPHALATLASALSAISGPRVDTLRTLVGFLERLEPRSPVLATQIAAFVDQVVIGREGKLAQLLVAYAQASPGPEAAAPPPPGGAGETKPAGRAGPDNAAPFLPLAAGRVAIGEAALDYDLKTQLLAVLKADPDADSGAPVLKSQVPAGALTGVLSAVTALQAGAAAILAANPDGLTFALPIALSTGFVRARVRVDRDAPQIKNVPLDGDNFHVAFILETQHIGTVAVDLVTVGRSVTLGVKTEAMLAQRLFGGALSGLTQRLEALRYHVAKAEAVVAPRGSAHPQPEPAAAVPPADGTRLVDLDA